MKSLIQNCKKMFFKLIVLSCLIGIAFSNVVKPTLKGVTIAHPPFVTQENATFAGFTVDLVSLIAEKAGFQYELYNSPDSKYGMLTENGTMNGMIGEVNQKKADFAIADLTITNTRKKFVDFTEPFMSSTLSAALNKENLPAGATALGDLLSTNMTFTCIATGSTARTLKESTSPLGQSLWKRISDAGALVSSNNEGIERVKATPTVLVTEHSYMEYLAGFDCQLAVLPDTSGLSNIQYGIAVQKSSPWLAPFNEAIKQLKAEGKLTELRKKYWKNQCVV